MLLTRRNNRKFLRAYEPAATQERLVVSEEHCRDKEPDVESAWGAGEYVLPSSDSTNARRIISPTDSSQMVPAEAGHETRRSLSPGLRDDVQGVNPAGQIGERSLVNVQPTVPGQTQDVGLRRSSRANKGKTTKFRDCVTGEELEALGSDP